MTIRVHHAFLGGILIGMLSAFFLPNVWVQCVVFGSGLALTLYLRRKVPAKDTKPNEK